MNLKQIEFETFFSHGKLFVLREIVSLKEKKIKRPSVENYLLQIYAMNSFQSFHKDFIQILNVLKFLPWISLSMIDSFS